MRLLHLSDRLSARGGADWHLLGVLAALQQHHDQLFAAGADDGSAPSPCPWHHVPGLGGGADTDLRTRLDRLAADFAPDRVHIHNALHPTALEWAADHGAVATVQDHRSFCPGSGKLTLVGAPCREPMSRAACRGCFDDAGYFERITTLTERRLAALRRMSAITVLSRYMKGELVQLGIEADRIRVQPPFVHGLDLEAEPDGEPCVLFVGRVVANKGVRDAVEAWRRAAIDLPLVFAGTGSLRRELERDGFQVTGWLDHHALSRVYRRARAVLMPSRWQEPFGIVGLEAYAMGVPVVAYDSGGVAEWHPGDGLVPWGDVQALGDALRQVLSPAAASVATPIAGFEQAAMTQRLEQLYRTLGAHSAVPR
jgi:glycosyltransferase involved in cell wall biosynthesis